MNILDFFNQFCGIGYGQLGGCGRGRCPEISNEIGYCKIDFMADGADHRYVRVIDRTGDDFFIECPEVLDGSPSPSNDEEIDLSEFVEFPNSLRDFLRGAGALDFHGPKDQLDRGK